MRAGSAGDHDVRGSGARRDMWRRAGRQNGWNGQGAATALDRCRRPGYPWSAVPDTACVCQHEGAAGVVYPGACGVSSVGVPGQNISCILWWLLLWAAGAASLCRLAYRLVHSDQRMWAYSTTAWHAVSAQGLLYLDGRRGVAGQMGCDPLGHAYKGAMIKTPLARINQRIMSVCCWWL